MIHKKGRRVILRTATMEDLEAIYYWKYVDKGQAAKKWNGPYIPEKQMTKTEFLKEWAND
ncbi:hypothetical protein ACIQ1H_04745 [Lysinibacillus sp. NPDC097279]|uniref:hypothetical protein n=1 Tax=Lysinibacillus sp. NPDC097279 TaxID=3364143 RepID=UPI00382C9EE1